MGKVGRVIILGAIVVGVLTISGVKVADYYDKAKNYVMSNEQVSSYIEDNLNVAKKLTQIASDSKTVKYDPDTHKVSVCIGTEWVPFNKIEKVSDFDGNSCKVVVEGKEYLITDKDLISLIELLKK